MTTTKLPLTLSRIALAFCFFGFGIWELIHPSLWTTYLPAYLIDVHPIVLIQIHGFVLSAAAIGVLSGYFPRLFSGISTLLLLNICVEIFLQEGFTDVFIRDVSLFIFTAALFADDCIHRKHSSK